MAGPVPSAGRYAQQYVGTYRTVRHGSFSDLDGAVSGRAVQGTYEPAAVCGPSKVPTTAKPRELHATPTLMGVRLSRRGVR
jgi:hypothetical protein